MPGGCFYSAKTGSCLYQCAMEGDSCTNDQAVWGESRGGETPKIF